MVHLKISRFCLFFSCFGWNFNAMAAAAALDTGFCHLIGLISSDVIGWTRSIRFCQSKRPLCIYFSSVFFISFHFSAYFSSVFSKSFHYSTYFSSVFSISFHYSTYLSSIFSISYHYSTCLSSIFSISFHYFLLYFSTLFTIWLTCCSFVIDVYVNV